MVEDSEYEGLKARIYYVRRFLEQQAANIEECDQQLMS